MKIEHSIIDGLRDILRLLLEENPETIRSVIPIPGRTLFQGVLATTR